jgi:hypothetical protein
MRYCFVLGFLLYLRASYRPAHDSFGLEASILPNVATSEGPH